MAAQGPEPPIAAKGIMVQLRPSLRCPMAAMRGLHPFTRNAASVIVGSESDFAALPMNGGFELHV